MGKHTHIFPPQNERIGFNSLKFLYFEVARPEGLEPPTRSLEGCRSIQLS